MRNVFASLLICAFALVVFFEMAFGQVWGFSTGETRAHESAPIVNNGVMFVTTPMK